MKYLALDVETGGLEQGVSLLEVYLLVLDENMSPGAELELRVKPDDGKYVVTAQALAVNGIDLIQHDKVAETFKQAGTRLYQFIQKQSGSGKEKLIPLGHGVAFDLPWLRGPGALIAKGSWEQCVSYIYADTGVSTRLLQDAGLIPRGVKHNLTDLAAHFGLDHKDAHTARGDALMTAEVYRRLIALARKGAK